mmetsp:Transcript_5906/g.8760  ORF Transcript_5906/g.8760 Transcript_5906/m.8760 type:complete len:398 (-) Transcript_5906:16-1209(-)
MEKEPWEIQHEKSFIVGYFFTINMIVGSGVLGIPWAWQQAGWGLGLVSQGASIVYFVFLSVYTFQVMSRIELLQRLLSSGYSFIPVGFSSLFGKLNREDFVQKTQETESALVSEEFSPRVPTVRVDFAEMVGLVFGRKAQYGVLVVFCLEKLILMSGYSIIFSSSCAALIPIGTFETCNIYEDNEFGGSCRLKVWFYLLVFGVVVVYLSIKGIAEQVWWQGSTCAARFLVITILIVTSLVAIFSDTKISDNEEIDHSPPVFEVPQLGIIVSVTLVAFSFQYGIPNICEALKDKEKDIPRVSLWAIGTVSVLYTLLGLVVPFAVEDIDPMVTLDWENYSGGSSERSWWAYGVASFVLIFPAIDITSIFPILSIILTDNLISVNYGQLSKNKLTRVSFT